MSKFPQDIIVDILTYLPVKPLLRFKCVSKSWQSLISDPQFANNTNRQRLLVATDPPHSLDFEAASNGEGTNPIVEIHPPYNYSVSPGRSFGVGLFLGSCNGLVCILNEVDNMVLWNPSTRESKELPPPSSSLHEGFCTGLGYDSSNDDYKIVIATSTSSSNDSKQIMVEIFSLKRNTWRITEGIHSADISLGGYHGVFWNGAVHWLMKQEGVGLADHLGWNVLVSFDAAEERFMDVKPLPNCFSTAVLSISKNCLCIFGTVHPEKSCYEAWITGEYDIVKTSWRRRFTFPTEKLLVDCYSEEMWLTNKGEILIDHHGYPGLLELYHPLNDSRKLFKVEHDSDPFYESEIYTESLVSPHVF